VYPGPAVTEVDCPTELIDWDWRACTDPLHVDPVEGGSVENPWGDGTSGSPVAPTDECTSLVGGGEQTHYFLVAGGQMLMVYYGGCKIGGETTQELQVDFGGGTGSSTLTFPSGWSNDDDFVWVDVVIGPFLVPEGAGDARIKIKWSSRVKYLRVTAA
jgi:hypothetical protein